MKKLQDNLGLFNDYSVQQEALLEFVATQSNAQGRANAQLAMSVGGLIAVLDQRQKAERDRVMPISSISTARTSRTCSEPCFTTRRIEE